MNVHATHTCTHLHRQLRQRSAADRAPGLLTLPPRSQAVEIVRRTVWAIFRIEWEYVVKVIPSERYMSVPLNSPCCQATPDTMSEGSDIETMPIKPANE